MTINRGHILWVDDEIDHLRPHILLLQEKGYKTTTLSNGQDAIEYIRKQNTQLVLIDQYMPGLDGLETIRQIRQINQEIPIILITKSDEESLMDAAIGENVVQYLIKPINPSQVFTACKQVLEERQIRKDKATRDYLQEFQSIDQMNYDSMDINNWWQIYQKIVNWQINFDKHTDIGLESILSDQIHTFNSEFAHFILKNYPQWVTKNESVKPILSNSVLSSFAFPDLKSGKKVIFILVDGLRFDQLMTILPELSDNFDYQLDYFVSILPSATSFSRNAIFSGLLPDDLMERYPEQKELMLKQTSSLNRFEKQFLADQLKFFHLDEKSHFYQKIVRSEDGVRLKNRASDLMNIDLITLVVNFVDMLAHKRSESDVLMEMVPDEAGYRHAVRNWFRHSWLLEMLKEFKAKDHHIIITGDHGSIRVQQSAIVGGDRSTSSGIRYKYGRNLNSDDRNAVVIKDPARYRLPVFDGQTNYLIAKGNTYFLYPTQYHKYKSMLSGSFQHGGISLEEMMVPVLTLSSK
ncbi:MAG: bifunctional response regulator/alkaline phosphatase family protein [Candidatus Neomarinimicrobiota bacterium]